MTQVVVTLTMAQAKALFQCADEGLTGLSDEGTGVHWSTLRAADRALGVLAAAMQVAEAVEHEEGA